MRSNPAQVLAAFLVQRGLAVFGGSLKSTDWPVTVSAMPTDGDNFLTVYNNGVVVDGRDHRTGRIVGNPSVVIRIRAKDDPTGTAKAAAIQAELNRVGLPAARGGLGWVAVTVPAPLAAPPETVTLQVVKTTTTATPVGQSQDGRRQLFSMTVSLTLLEP